MKNKQRIVLVSLIGAAVLGISAYTGYNSICGTLEHTEESDLLLENIEALALDEESEPIRYTVHHSKCYTNGIETGKYYAWCYTSPSGGSTCHSHSCSDCSSY